MHFADMTWKQVERYLESDDRVIVIVGACEQHCGLSLLSDVIVPVKIAEQVAAKERVLVAPPVNYGVSPLFAAFPGTVSLSVETLCSLMREIVLGLYGQGFKRVMILNGHGGNAALPSSLQALAEQHHDLQMQFLDWWRMPVALEFFKKVGKPNAHANWCENFSFNRVDQPSGEKEFVNLPRFGPSGYFRDLLGDGSFGGAYGMPDETMTEYMGIVVDEISRLMREGWS